MIIGGEVVKKSKNPEVFRLIQANRAAVEAPVKSQTAKVRRSKKKEVSKKTSKIEVDVETYETLNSISALFSPVYARFAPEHVVAFLVEKYKNKLL